MTKLACDVCHSPVVEVYAQPQGLRPGRRTAPQRILAGYRCTNMNCRRARGFGMGERPVEDDQGA